MAEESTAITCRNTSAAASANWPDPVPRSTTVEPSRRPAGWRRHTSEAEAPFPPLLLVAGDVRAVQVLPPDARHLIEGQSAATTGSTGHRSVVLVDLGVVRREGEVAATARCCSVQIVVGDRLRGDNVVPRDRAAWCRVLPVAGNDVGVKVGHGVAERGGDHIHRIDAT